MVICRNDCMQSAGCRQRHQQRLFTRSQTASNINSWEWQVHFPSGRPAGDCQRRPTARTPTAPKAKEMAGKNEWPLRAKQTGKVGIGPRDGTATMSASRSHKKTRKKKNKEVEIVAASVCENNIKNDCLFSTCYNEVISVAITHIFRTWCPVLQDLYNSFCLCPHLARGPRNEQWQCLAGQKSRRSDVRYSLSSGVRWLVVVTLLTARTTINISPFT